MAFGIGFSYTRIKQKAFQGYTTKREGDTTTLIAEPEKALADYLYFVSLGKKTLNDRLSIRNLDMKKVREYAKLFDRPSVLRLVETAINMPEPEIY